MLQQQQQQQQSQYAAGLQHQQMMLQQGIYGQLPSASSRGSDYATSRISSQSGVLPFSLPLCESFRTCFVDVSAVSAGGPPSPVPQGIMLAPANGKPSEYSAFDPSKINRQNQQQMNYQQPQLGRQSSLVGGGAGVDPRMATGPRGMGREPEWAPATYLEKGMFGKHRAVFGQFIVTEHISFCVQSSRFTTTARTKKTSSRSTKMRSST